MSRAPGELSTNRRGGHCWNASIVDGMHVRGAKGKLDLGHTPSALRFPNLDDDQSVVPPLGERGMHRCLVGGRSSPA